MVVAVKPTDHSKAASNSRPSQDTIVARNPKFINYLPLLFLYFLLTGGLNRAKGKCPRP